MFKDALDKLETKRTLYGTALSELSWRAMQVAGWNQERPTVAWPNPLPFNETAEVAVLTQEMSAKILSRQSAAEQRGRDWERELKRMEEERDLDREGLGQVLARAMRDFDRDRAPVHPSHGRGQARWLIPRWSWWPGSSSRRCWRRSGARCW